MTTAYQNPGKPNRDNQNLARHQGGWRFIGSNLQETLLKLNQRVGLDNFATGHQRNLMKCKRWSPQNSGRVSSSLRATSATWKIVCRAMILPSWRRVGEGPRPPAPPSTTSCTRPPAASHASDPITTNSANITGFLNLLVAARDAQVQSFTLPAAAHLWRPPRLPLGGEIIGINQLSPLRRDQNTSTSSTPTCFAPVATVFRPWSALYFNVFGPRRDLDGAYAAVIPKMDGGHDRAAKEVPSTATAKPADFALLRTPCRLICWLPPRWTWQRQPGNTSVGGAPR